MCMKYDGDIPPYFNGNEIGSVFYVTSDFDSEELEYNNHKKATAEAVELAKIDDAAVIYIKEEKEYDCGCRASSVIEEIYQDNNGNIVREEKEFNCV